MEELLQLENLTSIACPRAGVDGCETAHHRLSHELAIPEELAPEQGSWNLELLRLYFEMARSATSTNSEFVSAPLRVVLLGDERDCALTRRILCGGDGQGEEDPHLLRVHRTTHHRSKAAYEFCEFRGKADFCVWQKAFFSQNALYLLVLGEDGTCAFQCNQYV